MEKIYLFNMTILSILATVFGTFMGLANIPQAIKIFKRKSAKDISIITYSLIWIGTIVWTIYGFELNNQAVIIANGLGAIITSFVMVGWFLYGKV